LTPALQDDKTDHLISGKLFLESANDNSLTGLEDERDEIASMQAINDL